MSEAIILEKNKVEWLNQIKRGNSKALELLYRAHRKNFVLWLCQNTTCDTEMALDIFQETVLAFYKNAKSGKLEHFSSSIKTYLFAIGRNIYLHRNRQNKIKTSKFELEDLPLEQLLSAPKSLDPDSRTVRQQLITKLLGDLRLNCKLLLHAFYYENLRMKEIAQKLKYKNVNVAKVAKVRCMEALRKMVFMEMKKR